jgi:hypothetical protein
MADSDHPDDDKKVKDLLDPQTQADLARWFGMPSFEQLADQGKQPAPPPEEDPELVELRRRRAAAIAAVDPRFLTALDRRAEPATMMTFEAAIELRDEPAIGFDMTLTEQKLAEPREFSRPRDIEEQLSHNAPQALLRDLHRAELTFDKQFEVFDPLGEARLSASELVAEAMTTRWAPTPGLPLAGFLEARAELHELREIRRQPWIHIKMPNRRVTE